ncbi:MAG TPA: RNA polymerase sigma factor [Vicinamibacterales bacterium]|jgi:RNA polymerase sigma-70 factor (ECF subfamily)
MTPDVTFTDLAHLDADVSEAARTFQMDEDAFRRFYDRTARSLWAYLWRTTGDARLADDLLQEVYYRFLRSAAPPTDENHRRNYLFRIATNLVRDARRRRAFDALEDRAAVDATLVPSGEDLAARSAQRIDIGRAMARLTVRERGLLWLAYANGCSHQEIATALGLKASSIKMLLFRARRRLAMLLGGGGR